MDWLARARKRVAGGVVVVTGASSGIGRAFAARLAPSGATFVLLARRADLLAETARAVEGAGGSAVVQPVDLRDTAAGTAAAQAVLADVGTPTVVFANAGHSIARTALACAERPDTIERSVAVNLTGAIAHALPLVAAMADAGAGHLIGSSTATARLSVPGWGPYQASKAGWDAWLRSIAPELRPHGVRVSVLAFGLVDTPMVRGGRPWSRRFALSPDEAAGWAARAIVTGRTRIAPWWVPPVETVHAVAPDATARLIGRFGRA